MKYQDGLDVTLGDIVNLPAPGGTAKARIVMLDSYEHLDIDARFVSWVKAEKKLEGSFAVAEWLEANPFAHNDSAYAPVGNYIFTPIDEHVTRVA